MVANPEPHLGFTLISLLLIWVASISVSNGDTVYEILPLYGLPSGLLPDTVTNYTLSDDGRFVVLLKKTCYIKFDYLVYYEKKITGILSYGSISHLHGIQVQRFLLWLDVDQIRVDLPPSDCIYFQVGLINKKLDIEQFQTVHSCRDGVSASCGGFEQPTLELPTSADENQTLLAE